MLCLSIFMPSYSALLRTVNSPHSVALVLHLPLDLTVSTSFLWPSLLTTNPFLQFSVQLPLFWSSCKTRSALLPMSTRAWHKFCNYWLLSTCAANHHSRSCVLEKLRCCQASDNRLLADYWLVRNYKLPDPQPHWAQKQHSWIWETLISPPAVANINTSEKQNTLYGQICQNLLWSDGQKLQLKAGYVTLLKIRSKNSLCFEIYFSNIRFGKSSFLVEEIVEKTSQQCYL